VLFGILLGIFWEYFFVLKEYDWFAISISNSKESRFVHHCRLMNVDIDGLPRSLLWSCLLWNCLLWKYLLWICLPRSPSWNCTPVQSPLAWVSTCLNYTRFLRFLRTMIRSHWNWFQGTKQRENCLWDFHENFLHILKEFYTHCEFSHPHQKWLQK